jgi:predicted ArsR family transcriptional regulator
MKTIDSTPTGRQRTRDAILELLKRLGPQDAVALSQRLGLSPMAVRLHLYQMQRDQLVTYDEVRRPLGRPAKLWRLTPGAGRLFPDRHSHLAALLLAVVRRAFGTGGLQRALALYSCDQAGLYRRGMLPGSSLEDRVRVLCDLRSQEDYMAEVEAAADEAFILVENHCPIRAAAASCGELCEAELASFRAALGKTALVERREHILAGAGRCSFRVARRQAGREAGRDRRRCFRRSL